MAQPAALPPDASVHWPDALRSGGQARKDALLGLRAHLAAAARFELDRRGIARDGLPTKAVARLVRAASEAALAAALADLGSYRGQSAFATWTAKYAIHEAAAAARANGTARDSRQERVAGPRYEYSVHESRHAVFDGEGPTSALRDATP